MKTWPFAFCMGIAGLGSQPATASAIAPHQAVYDLSLVQLRKGADLSSVTGRLAFEIDGSTCEGWSTSFRMMNRFQPNEGDTKLLDTQTTSFESADGLSMRLNQKEYLNGALNSETRIAVSRDAVAQPAKGERGEAGTAPFVLPGNVMFPMQHQLRLMTEAEAGANRDDSIVYDGSDAEKTFRVITFIGKRKAPGSNAHDNADRDAAALSAIASWPVTISYYRNSTGAPDTPEYQVSFDLYENGVATGLVLDYDDFVLGGDLSRLEFGKATPCP